MAWNNHEDPANPKNVWTSDGTGVFFVGELPYGTYCIQENPTTTPDGYNKPSDGSYKVFQIKEGEVWDATGTSIITEFTM